MWGVPVDHDMFAQISPGQWLWYFYNFMEDNIELYEKNRDLVEYHASFIEPAAVRKIREGREKAIEVPENEFMAGIKQIFGRDLINTDKPKENKLHKIDLGKVLSEYNIRKQNVEKVIGGNPKEWFNFKLE